MNTINLKTGLNDENCSNEATKIWLCDLTYTQQTIASDVMPAAVGSIATYTFDYLDTKPDIKIFKFPEKLVHALENESFPDVIGFSNYIWNENLSSQFANVIKKNSLGTIIVMGGPNYPTSRIEQEEFIRRHPMIDYYIVKEAELAFAKLVDALQRCNFNKEEINLDLPSIHCILPNGDFHVSENEERIMDLAEIPSPYLDGLMDEFFNGVMLPIVQTNRGCPFKCTFCVEGEKYYSRVTKSKVDKIEMELHYIGKKMHELSKNNKFRSDMFIADSNFGMYKEDIKTCKIIADVQEKYGFPKYINVATGKNQKKRVLEAASIINGALRISGSVQSLNKDVLINIERSNINEEEIIGLSLSASEIGANSYSEIILGLPGDSVDAHMETIRKIVEADFNTIALFQLMLLPGTHLSTRESIEKWGMSIKYRVLPRCFGNYEVLGEQINAAEIEEICIGNNTLNFDEYLQCRKLHMVINLFYNDAVFKEALRLIKYVGLSKYDWMVMLLNYSNNEGYNNVIKKFINETTSELWDSREELEGHARTKENIEKYINGEFGANLIFKYKTLGLIFHSHDLADVAKKTLINLFNKNNIAKEYINFGCELIDYACLRMSKIFFEQEDVISGLFRFNVVKFSNNVTFNSIDSFRFSDKTKIKFTLTDQQKKTIENYINIYGDSIIGIGRILSKVYVRKLYRQAEYINDEQHMISAIRNDELTILENRLTGLNEYL